MKIIFVCTGNTCRSPMAEAYFKYLCEKSEQDIEICSAGTFAGFGEPVAANSVQIMTEYNIDLANFGSTPLSSELVNSADMIICMTSSHRFQVGAINAKALKKTHLLGDFADNGHDIADPYGSPLPGYRNCFEEMKPLLEKLLQKVIATKQ